MKNHRPKSWLLILFASRLFSADSVDIRFERALSDSREALQLTCSLPQHCSLKESPTGRTETVPYKTAENIAKSFLANLPKTKNPKKAKKDDVAITQWSVTFNGDKSEGAVLKSQLEAPPSVTLKKTIKSVNTLELRLRALLTK